MKSTLDGQAIVYCQGAFNTPNGKTAHGLVRFTERYEVLSVIDQVHAGQDAGMVLDGKPNGIAIFPTVEAALLAAKQTGKHPTHFVIGIAPDGGRLSDQARKDVTWAIAQGLNVDSGLHDFLSENQHFIDLAKEHNVKLRDVRKPPHRSSLHFFSGAIEQVDCLKLAVLGTDSAVGKRTTAWIIVHGFRKQGKKAEMIGTGQTGWMQGAKYSLVLDSLINDFVSGEIEHAVVEAYKHEQPDVIVIEGQGSLMNPAYPGGFEILAAGRPDAIILQHAPARLEYDGFPGYPMHPLPQQIEAIEMISGKPVIAITLNHEMMTPTQVEAASLEIEEQTGLPCTDVLLHGPDKLLKAIQSFSG